MAVGRIPPLARSSVERLPNSRIGPSAIVWSADEFDAATRAFLAILDEGNGRRRAPRRRRRQDGAALLTLAGVPRELQRLSLWFGERYRAHAPRITAMHLDRFHAIWGFLGRHMDRLTREGWVTSSGGGLALDGDLLTALVGMDYRPTFFDAAKPEPCIGSYDAVVSLAEAIAVGEARVEEFQRTPFDGAVVSEVAYESPPDWSDTFAFGDFQDAMTEWSRLNERRESDLRAEAAVLRSSMPAGLGDVFDGPPAVSFMFLWFLDRYRDAEGAQGLLVRFLAMSGFIEEHLDALVAEGLMVRRGEGHFITGALFSSLNATRVEVVARDSGPEPFDFDSVVAMARAHRELLGDDRMIIPGEPARPLRDRLRALGRNDPCPCGSGRKVKRCCWARMT